MHKRYIKKKRFKKLIMFIFAGFIFCNAFILPVQKINNGDNGNTIPKKYMTAESSIYFEGNNKKKAPQVLIFHTHTTECYISDIKQLHRGDVPSRTKDLHYSVVRVGDELARNLSSKYGIAVIHNSTVHDYPSFSQAYNKSLYTVQKILKKNPSVKIVLDIHRDGLDNKKLREVTNVNGRNAAQIMLVVGSGNAISKNPGWKGNLEFARKLQNRLDIICPGLAKPIRVSRSRYNQHVSDEALLIEIGGDGNLMSECLESTKYIAKALNDVMKGKK